MEIIKDDGDLTTTHTAEAEGSEGGTFGKFKDRLSLVRAYESLEAEFTRRSQRLKQLEREAEKKGQSLSEDKALSAPSGESDEAEVFLKRFPRAEALSLQIATLATTDTDKSAGRLERAYAKLLEQELTASENKLKDRDFLMQKVKDDPSVANEIVKNYLLSIAGAKPKVAFGGGNALSIPPLKPKNIDEAGEMSRKYFKDKGETIW